jgi:uncharacterized protein GlcG (DUF336 family)
VRDPSRESGVAELSKKGQIGGRGPTVHDGLGDEVIGSIGAAGAPGAKLDDGCARAGLDRIRDRLK